MGRAKARGEVFESRSNCSVFIDCYSKRTNNHIEASKYGTANHIEASKYGTAITTLKFEPRLSCGEVYSLIPNLPFALFQAPSGSGHVRWKPLQALQHTKPK